MNRGRGRRGSGGGRGEEKEEARGGGGGDRGERGRGRGRRRAEGREEERDLEASGGRGERRGRGRAEGRGGREERPRRAVNQPGILAGVFIPDPVPAPVPRPIRLGSEPLVFFDIETTGFGAHSHIIQIAAVGPDSSYDAYVLPKIPIGARSTAVTGISLKRDLLWHHGRVVEAESITHALKGFFDFLGPGRVLLVGHNSKSFDSRVLITTATNTGTIDVLKRRTLGFIDTLPLFRKLFPRRKKHTLGDLHKSLIGEKFAAHNALADTLALRRLVEKVSPDPETLEAFAFDVEYVEASLAYLDMRKENMETLYPLENVNVTSSMLNKIAASGLRMEHLRAAYESDRENGIRELFAQPLADGKARVTRVKRIADNVRSYFNNAAF